MTRLEYIAIASIWCIPVLLFVFRQVQLRRRRRRWELDGRPAYPPLPLPCPPPPPAPKWHEFNPDIETLEECRDRRLLTAPLIDAAEREVLRQLREVTYDGNLASKSGRDSLIKRGLAVRWNGWQIASREGLALLETLGELREYDKPPSARGKQ